MDRKYLKFGAISNRSASAMFACSCYVEEQATPVKGLPLFQWLVGVITQCPIQRWKVYSSCTSVMILKSFSEETLRESVHAENEKGCAGSEPV